MERFAAEQAADLAEAALAAVPEHLREIARRVGMEFFGFVANGMNAAAGLGVLVGIAQKHGSRAGLQAAQIVQGSYNAMGMALAQTRGWTQESIVALQGELGEAERARVRLVSAGGIILNS